MRRRRFLEGLGWEDGHSEDALFGPGHHYEMASAPDDPLRDDDFRALSHLHDLVSLRLPRGPYPHLTRAFLQHLDVEHLRVLELHRVTLFDDFVFELENRRQRGELEGLTMFSLFAGKLTDQGLLHGIAHWDTLTHLSLGRAWMVSPAGLRALRRLTRLRELSLLVHLLPDAVEDELREALPACTFHLMSTHVSAR